MDGTESNSYNIENTRDMCKYKIFGAHTIRIFVSKLSVADTGSVPFCPLYPESRTGFFRIPDLGSQTQIFESLATIFR